MNIHEQIEELKLYFDDDKIYNCSDAQLLSPRELIKIKTQVKKQKNEGIYEVSRRLSVKLKDGSVSIINNRRD